MSGSESDGKLEALRAIGARFAIDGRFVDGRRYGNGHINDTFAATYETTRGRVRFVHQRINERVFPDIPGLMNNVGRVTRHLRGASLTLVPTRDGADFLRDDEGGFWRTYDFVEGAQTVQVPQTSEQVFAAAKAFGAFARALVDLPAPPLHDTIRGFHDTERRFTNLVASTERDPENRSARARDAIDFALAHAWVASALRGVHDGRIPQRVVHNDTKINNVLLSDDGRAHRVIDLDTVMPGYPLYDVGDMMRTGAATAAEDETDLSRVGVNTAFFAAIARGFVAGSDDLLAPLEREHFVTAAQVLTFETGVRFLTDFIEGDRYFRVHRPTHNLDRARNQFAMVRTLVERQDELSDIVARATGTTLPPTSIPPKP